MQFGIYALFFLRDRGRKRFLLILLSALCSNSTNWICSALRQGEYTVLPVNLGKVGIDCR